MDNFNSAFNFLLDAKRDELWWPDGTHADMPNQLFGISGCPIWQIVWPNGWHPDRVRIVGGADWLLPHPLGGQGDALVRRGRVAQSLSARPAGNTDDALWRSITGTFIVH